MAKQPREKTAETLGANVRYLREHASISQTELARRMTDRGWPWHQSTVYRVETGKQPVRFDEAVDLADLLGVTLDRLTWAIGEAAEEELATFAITSLRERMQEAAVAVTRLRIARAVAERRAKSAADSEYPHIRELADGIEKTCSRPDLGRRARTRRASCGKDTGKASTPILATTRRSGMTCTRRPAFTRP